ncbi:MAG: hypothetical protein R6W73_04225 [Candidatus Saliniplasma sp.]
MVIPIIAMLAVTMMIAGYMEEDEGEKQVEIEVDEGYDEMTVEYQPDPETPSGYDYQRSSIVTTSIDDDNSIELNVTVVDVINKLRGIEPGYGTEVYIRMYAEGDFEDDLSPETLELRARGLGSHNVSYNDHNIVTGREETGGCSRWSSGYSQFGRGTETANVGFDIEQNDFAVNSAEMDWQIPGESYGKPYTLEVQAVVGGFEEEIKATVHVHIDLFSEIVGFEAETDDEHYLTSDYTSAGDAEDNDFYVKPNLSYRYENHPGGEDVLYDAKIYVRSQSTNEEYELIHTENDIKAGEDHTSEIKLNVSEEADELGMTVRFVIEQQEGPWDYDTLEDDEFDLSFTVTNDGGGE